ncbi:MAG: PIN/TRAM domain-containing protein [Planctomycetota bacterium]
MTDRKALDALHPDEAAKRQRTTLVSMLRLCFTAIFVVVLVLALFAAEGPASESDRIATIGGRELAIAADWYLKLSLGIIIAAVVLLVDIYTPRKRLSTLAAIFFGLAAALLVTLAVGRLIDLLAQLYSIEQFFGGNRATASAFIGVSKVLIGIGLSYVAVVFVLETKDDFRLVIPYIEFAKQIRGVRPMVLDTSAAVDARFKDVAENGLIQAPVVIPGFVIAELHMLADSHDKLKRARGRRGLDAITKLQRSATLDVTIDETPVPGKAVDQMLVELCRNMPAVLVTTDTGLARVAGIQGVRVLNINDLANAVKATALPGEVIRLKLIKPGEQPTQAVGYLDDGTMVVAEDGVEHIGQEVDLTVASALQTSAGRMIFAKIDATERTDHAPNNGIQDTRAQEQDTTDRQATDDADQQPADSPATKRSSSKPDQPAKRGPHPPKPPAEPSRGRNPRR